MKKIIISSLVVLLALSFATALPHTARAEGKDKSENKNKQNVSVNAKISGLQELINRLQTMLAALQNGSSTGKLPPGIGHAPGIEKRLEKGKGLPAGLLKKLFGHDYGGHNSTSTDPTAPYITNITVSAGTSTATISWQTTATAQSAISYSSTTPVNASSTSVSDSSLVLNHQMTLTGLDPNTTYYYVIVATDSANRSRTTATLHFKTLAQAIVDVTAPNITFVTSTNVTGSAARIIWVTNELSDSRLWVGTSTPIDTGATPIMSSNTLSFYHELNVSGLATSTQYFYVVGSKDASGNNATTTNSSFTTLGL